MKKIFLSLYIFFMFSTAVFAQSNDLYNLTLPNTYNKSISDNTHTFWEKKDENIGSSVLILLAENDSSFDISNYNSSDIKKHEESFVNSFKSKLQSEGYTVSIENVTSSLKKINGYNSIIFNIESNYTIGENKSATIFQRQYIFSSKNYFYYLTFASSSLEYLNSKEVGEIISSFKINDELIQNNNISDNVLIYIGLGILILIVIVLATKKDIKKEF